MLDRPAKYRFSLKAIPPSQRRDVAAETARRAWPVSAVSAAKLPWAGQAAPPAAAPARGRLDFSLLPGELEMELDSCVMPGIVVTHALLSPHRTISTHAHAHESDDFALIWSAAPAHGCIEQLGKELFATGEAALMSCAERVSCEARDTFGHVSVRLQRSALLPLLPDAEAALVRPIPAGSEALRLLASYLAGLRELDESRCTGEFARMVATHVIDLVALAVGTNRDATQLAAGRGLSAARLAAVKRWTRARLESPRLNVNAAAKAACLSPRSVQLLFESEGDTFSNFVLRERLALARRRLSTPRLAGLSVTSIALDSGFGNLSHFSRSFRATYGESPTDARRKACGNSSEAA